MLPLPLYLTRVIDVTTSLSGAIATRSLGDFGAEVIRVESTETAESAREDSLAFERLHRNKFSFLTNGSEEAQKLVEALVKTADVVIVDSGDSAATAARYDAVVITLTGGDSANAGLIGAGAAITALFHRRTTGEGLRIMVTGANVAALRAASSSVATGQSGNLAIAQEQVALSSGEIVILEGVPYRLSRTHAHIRLPAPRPGEHTEYVLREVLGFKDDAIEALRKSGVIG
jgi:crotonobetainyl-CoA:carnitine CoA-transferase CaiB-like acyl-CoA transferase